MNKKILANFALFLTGLIWGVSFVAQKAGMDYVGPFGFNFARSILGGLSLIPVIFVAKMMKEDTACYLQVQEKPVLFRHYT